jgi:hypothetical protein
MSRIKIYYSADEMKNNLYTTGSQLMTELGTNYIGLYHVYNTGETFSGAMWNPITSIKLIPYTEPNETINVYKSINPINTAFQHVSIYKPTISSNDIATGYILRYFLKKINETLFLEISEESWRLWQSNKIDRNLYAGVEMQWYIVGNTEDVIENGVLKQGVVSKNKKQIAAAEFTVPGISKKLTNPLEFYTDTDFVVPRDINLG